MTAEIILTDEQVRNIIEDVAWPNEEVFKFAVEVARAIEQAILQSEQLQATEAYPCRIVETDFETNTVTLEMQGKYTVSSGQKYLCDVPLYRCPAPNSQVNLDSSSAPFTPKTASEMRSFIGMHFDSLRYANPETEEPDEMDRYTLTIHDLLSAFSWAGHYDCDHIPADSKMIDDAGEALRDALDLVGLDMGAYSSPKEALAALIDWHVSVATDPRTNGGWQLVPVEPKRKGLVFEYRQFSEWCRANPSFDLDSRLHSHGGTIDNGGYISDKKTRIAFAAWRAAKKSLAAAPQSAAEKEKESTVTGQGEYMNTNQ